LTSTSMACTQARQSKTSSPRTMTLSPRSYDWTRWSRPRSCLWSRTIRCLSSLVAAGVCLKSPLRRTVPAAFRWDSTRRQCSSIRLDNRIRLSSSSLQRWGCSMSERRCTGHCPGRRSVHRSQAGRQGCTSWSDDGRDRRGCQRSCAGDSARRSRLRRRR